MAYDGAGLIENAPDLSVYGSVSGIIADADNSVGSGIGQTVMPQGRNPYAWHKVYIPMDGPIVIDGNPDGLSATGDAYLLLYSGPKDVTNATALSLLVFEAQDDDSGGNSSGKLSVASLSAWGLTAPVWLYVASGSYSAGGLRPGKKLRVTQPTRPIVQASAINKDSGSARLSGGYVGIGGTTKPETYGTVTGLVAVKGKPGSVVVLPDLFAGEPVQFDPTTHLARLPVGNGVDSSVFGAANGEGGGGFVPTLGQIWPR